MRSFVLCGFLLIGHFVFSQNIIEVSISKIGLFAKYGKDSLHKMIEKSECGHFTKSYNPVNLKLVINKAQKKVYRFKDYNSPHF